MAAPEIIVGTGTGNKTLTEVHVDVGATVERMAEVIAYGTEGGAGNKTVFKEPVCAAQTGTAPVIVSDTELTVQWLLPSEGTYCVSDYKVFWKSGSSMAGNTANADGSFLADGTDNGKSLSSVAHTGLTADTTYYYIIKGHRWGEDSSGQTTETSAKTKKAPVTAATTFDVGPQDKASSSTQGEVSVTAVANADTYRLRWKVTSDSSNWDSDYTSEQSGLSAAQIVSATRAFGSFTHGQVVYVNVRGENVDSNGPWVGTSGSFTNLVEAPGTPSAPTVSGTGTSSRTVSTSAGSGGTPDLYRWQKRSVACGGNIGAASWVADGTSAGTSKSSSVSAKNDYQWRVRAENDGGNSSYSGASATEDVRDSLATPVITVGTKTTTSIAVSIGAITGADDYNFEIRPSGGSWTVSTQAGLSKTFTGLSQDSEYDIRVRARQCSGDTTGSYDTETGVWTLLATPGTPTFSVNPKPVTTNDDQIEGTVSTLPTDADSVTLHASTTSGFTPSGANQIGTSTGPFTHSSLNANEKWYYKIVATNSPAAGSPNSAATSTSTQQDARTCVSNPTITGWTQSGSGCTPATVNLTVDHDNTDGDARTSSWEYRERLNAAAWSSWTAGSGTSESVNVGNAVDMDTAHVEVRYTNDTSFSDSDSQTILCTT